MTLPTLRKKPAPAPLPRAVSSRALAARVDAPRPAYAALFASARAAGLFALCTIAPLGTLAGSVSACGAAAPTHAYPTQATSATGATGASDPGAQVAPPTGEGTVPAPLGSIAPPSASTGAPTPPTTQ